MHGYEWTEIVGRKEVVEVKAKVAGFTISLERVTKIHPISRSVSFSIKDDGGSYPWAWVAQRFMAAACRTTDFEMIVLGEDEDGISFTVDGQEYRYHNYKSEVRRVLPG